MGPMLFLLLTTLGCRNKDLAIDTAGLVSVDDSTTVVVRPGE